MKKLILFLSLITVSHLVVAEEEVEISTNGKVSIPLETRNQGVFVQFAFSEAMTKEFRKRLASLGYTLADDKSDAAAVINISGNLYIKGQGDADLGKYLETNGSTDFSQRSYSDTSNKFDGGVIHGSSNLTGGLGSGIILGALIGVVSDATGLTGSINRAWGESSESNKSVKVTVFAWTKADKRRQIFSAMAATNKLDYDTPALIASALSRAMEPLN